MTEPQRTSAIMKRVRGPGSIWLIPLVALAVVGWLMLHHWRERGSLVTVTFPWAEGVKAGDTKVKYRGIEVGAVEEVALAPDRSQVIVRLRVEGPMKETLREGTRFWITGSTPDLTNLGSLKSVLIGPSIGMDPGTGPPKTKFAGLAAPPMVMGDAAGMHLWLRADSLGTLRAGSSVTYRGLSVGTVEGSLPDAEGQGFAVEAFVRAPYDRFVHANSRFWKNEGIQLSTGGGGLKAEIAPLGALVGGGISFDGPDGAPPGGPAKDQDRFPLYEDRETAMAAPLGPAVRFLVRFNGPVGELSPGAPVHLSGFQVGQVASVALTYDPSSGSLQSPVEIMIDPARLGLGDDAAAAKAAIDQLVRKGLRAKMDRLPPLIGRKLVSLDFAPTAPPAQLSEDGAGPPEIPAAASQDVADLAGQLGAQVQVSLGHLDALLTSPRLAQSLDHLQSALARMDHLAGTADRQTGPLIASLRQTAEAAQQTIASTNGLLGDSQGKDLPAALDELSNAARSIRALADYLDQHPEALLRGRGTSTP